MRSTRFALLLLAAALVAAGPAAADSAVLATDGTLYEVYPTRYGDVVPVPEDSSDRNMPVLALSVTSPDGTTTVGLVDGTVDRSREGSVSVGFEDETGTLFVAYTKSTGLMADMHVAIHRDGVWSGQDILSNRGLYLSINPKVAVTRQQYLTFGPNGEAVEKIRSIFSLVWWEESGPSQARYAPIFVEDGALRVDAVEAWNLNELAGAAGPTDATGLPVSSYSFPSVQPDPTSNGGVLVTFANLATRAQQVLRISFADDLVALSPPGSRTVPEEAWARAHVPIGRSAGQGRIPAAMDTLSDVGAIASQKGVTTFYWEEGNALRFAQSTDAEGSPARRVALRTGFSVEKAIRLLEALAEKN